MKNTFLLFTALLLAIASPAFAEQPGSAAKTVSQYKSEGIRSLKAGKLDEAIASFNRALELEPENSQILLSKALALQKAGRLDDAEAIYTKLLSIEETPRVQSMLGILYERKGEPDKAKALYEKAIEKDPENAISKKRLAKLKEKEGGSKKSSADEFNRQGAKLFSAGKFDEAIELFDKGLKVEPENKGILFNRALAMQMMGRLDEAEAEYNKLVGMDKTARVLFMLGTLHEEKGNPGKAVQFFTEALEKAPTNQRIKRKLKAAKATAPEEAAPEEAAPEEAAPEEAAPEEAAPEEAAPEEAAPEEAAPEEAAPEEAAPEEAAPVEAAPVEAAPVEAAPEEAAPVEAAPVEAAPVEAAPEEAAPVIEPTESESEISLPGMAVPGAPIPGALSSGTDLSGKSLTDEVTLSKSAPEAAAPETKEPKLAVPEVIERVRIGYIPFNADLPFFVAMEKGFFKEEGVEVEATRFSNSGLAFKGMIAGRIDMMAGSAFSIFFKKAPAQPGKFKLLLPFAETDASTMSYVLARKGLKIDSLDKLRGKRVGTYTGATQILYLELFLKKIGLNPKRDVKLLQVPSSFQIQALEAKQIDVLFTVDPYGTIALDKGSGKILVKNPRSNYLMKPFWVGASAMDAEYAKNNPAAVKKIYRAMTKAIDYINENKDDSKKLLSKFTPIDERLAMKSGVYSWFKRAEDENFPSIQKLADLMHKNKLLKTKIDVRTLFFLESELQ